MIFLHMINLLPTIFVPEDLHTQTLTPVTHTYITFISGSFQIKENSL